MTEEEMRSLIGKLSRREKELREERHAYEKQLDELRKKQIFEDRKSFAGRCYKIDLHVPSNHRHIYTFKIIEVLEHPNENYAMCLTLVKGLRDSCFPTHGIQIETLPLWCPDSLRKIVHVDDPKMIDCYFPISGEDFQEEICKHLKPMKEYGLDVKPEKSGEIVETFETGKFHRTVSCCGHDCTQMTVWMVPDYCPWCGAKLKLAYKR